MVSICWPLALKPQQRRCGFVFRCLRLKQRRFPAKLGLGELNSNSQNLVGGAKAVFETLLSTAQSQLEAAGVSVPQLTIDNYAAVLDSVLDSLDETTVYDLAYIPLCSRSLRRSTLRKTKYVSRRGYRPQAGVGGAYWLPRERL